MLSKNLKRMSDSLRDHEDAGLAFNPNYILMFRAQLVVASRDARELESRPITISLQLPELPDSDVMMKQASLVANDQSNGGGDAA